MGRKIFYSIILSLALLPLFTFTSSTNADSGQAYEVGTDALNVRVKPDHSAEIIGRLDIGDHLIGFQEKHGWVQTYYDGKEAWVASQFLIKSQLDSVQESTSSNSSITINADSVRLRTGPGTDHTIINHTSQGDVYELIETNGDWYKVLLDDGSTAWVAAWLTSQGSVQQSSSNSNETSTNTTGSLDGYNIMLDPGHGGKDPGAFGINGEKEKDLTLATAKSVAEKLRNAGATVLLTRSDDTYISTQERVQISQSYWTDAFISLHYNAYPLSTTNGVSTHYYSSEPDYRLAQEIQTALQKHTNLNNRGVQNDSFYVIRENNDLSVLVELGFITNPKDNAIIHDANHRSSVANAITEGLINYFHQ